MCLVSNVFLAWLTTLGIMSETKLLVQNIFIHFCARGSLLFGHDAPSPDTISFDLPVHPLPSDHYAKHMLSRMQTAHQRFSQIKSDLRRHQKDIYDRKARFSEISSGKVVYIRKEQQTTRSGQATRFLRTFDGPFQVIGHPYD